MSNKEKNPTGRGWCFTINNPEMPDIKAWLEEKYAESGADYLVAQLEHGAEETRHIQGYIHYPRNQRFSRMKGLFPRAHIEVAKGRADQNRDYCTKDEGRLDGPWEFGTLPVQGRRMDMEALQRDLKSGMPMSEIKDVHFSAYMRYSKAISEYRLLTAKPRNWEMRILVLWGATGTGKSRYCHDNYPEAYWKTKNSGQMQFWDGYTGEETIIVDEFYGWLTFDFMLRFIDRYPCNLEIKHGTVPMLAKTVVFTSNKHPKDWYPNSRYQWDESNPLRRRITEVIEFPIPPSTPPLSPGETQPAGELLELRGRLVEPSTGDQSEELRLIDLYMQQ